jgi:transposase
MRKIREILRLKWVAQRSHREAARSLGVSPGAVASAVGRARATALTWEAVEALSDDALERTLYGPPPAQIDGARPEPDLTWIHQELRRPGVTLELLHVEYLAAHPTGYRYSAFCDRYRAWRARQRLSMRQVHKAGEKAFVDYAGTTPTVVDAATGEVIAGELFVAVLGASNYTFAEATRTQQSADWITSHVHAVEYFGGVPAVWVPDQLRTGVTVPCRYEPGVHFDEPFGVLVDAEQLFRDNRALTRRMKEAKLRIPHACFEDLDYAPRRGLDRAVIRQLAGGHWIVEHHNILITGATGVGKTYVACALGQQACRQGHRVIYRRLPRLFADLALAHADGSYIALLGRLARVDVLVLDDWGLGAVTERQRHDLLEIGPRWHAVDGHHQSAAPGALARLSRRSDCRRRHSRPAGASGSPARARRALATQDGTADEAGGGVRQAVDAARPMETSNRFPQVFGKPHRARFPTAPTAIIDGLAEERRPKHGYCLSLTGFPLVGSHEHSCGRWQKWITHETICSYEHSSG